MKNKIVYFEGLAGSGKTSVINMISNCLPNDTKVIKELPISEKDYDTLSKTEQDFFTHNDEKKYYSAKKAVKKYKYVLVDRGHLSTVVYNLAELIINKNIASLTILRWYFETVLKENKTPDVYVYIDVSMKLSLKRKPQNQNDTNNHWGNKNSIRLINNIYINMIKKFENKSKLIYIDNSDNKFSIQDISKIIINKLDEQK